MRLSLMCTIQRLCSDPFALPLSTDVLVKHIFGVRSLFERQMFDVLIFWLRAHNIILCCLYLRYVCTSFFFAFSSCIHWFYIWPIIVRVQREYYLVVVRIQLMKILNKWKKYLTRNNTKAGRSTNGNAIHTPAQLSFRTMYYTKVRCDDWYCGFCFFFSSTIIRVLMVEVLIVPPSSTLPLKKYNKFISFPSVRMVKRCDDEEFTPPVAIPTIIHSFIHQFYDYVKSMTCSHVNRVFPS